MTPGNGIYYSARYPRDAASAVHEATEYTGPQRPSAWRSETAAAPTHRVCTVRPIGNNDNLPWRGPDDAVRTSEFRCSTCGAVAVVVSRRGGGVAVTGFLGEGWHGASRFDQMVEEVELDEAIQVADAEVLHRLNPEFVPAWCPLCRTAYCQDHWSLEVVMADDYPGWYEATYGTCPEGHHRQLGD